MSDEDVREHNQREEDAAAAADHLIYFAKEFAAGLDGSEVARGYFWKAFIGALRLADEAAKAASHATVTTVYGADLEIADGAAAQADGAAANPSVEDVIPSVAIVRYQVPAGEPTRGFVDIEVVGFDARGAFATVATRQTGSADTVPPAVPETEFTPDELDWLRYQAGGPNKGVSAEAWGVDPLRVHRVIGNAIYDRGPVSLTADECAWLLALVGAALVSGDDFGEGKVEPRRLLSVLALKYEYASL